MAVLQDRRRRGDGELGSAVGGLWIELCYIWRGGKVNTCWVRDRDGGVGGVSVSSSNEPPIISTIPVNILKVDGECMSVI